MTDTVPSLEDFNVVEKMHVMSSTKDSVQIGWTVHEQYQSSIQGFKIQYQAEGSSIVQYTPLLEPYEKNYDIQNLHENTYYKMCIRTYTNLNSTSSVPCVRSTTTVDSLHVALGSTFGAFLALGIIVMFVFIAKWQNSRKLKKQLRNVVPTSDKYDSMEPNEGDIEMSDVANEAQSAKANDVHSYSSQVSGYHSYTNVSRKSIPSTGDCNTDAITTDQSKSNCSTAPVHSSPSNGSTPNQPQPPIIGPPPEPKNDSKVMRKQNSADSHRSSSSRQQSIEQGYTPPLTAGGGGGGGNSGTSPGQTPQTDNPTSQNTRKDYGGARPKEFSTNDPRNLYANQAYMELPETEACGLRPNLSCKW